MTGIMHNNFNVDYSNGMRGPLRIAGSEPLKVESGMNSTNFCYWLQGLLEVGDPKTLDEKQVKMIKDHLSLVFKKVTPSNEVPYASDSTFGITYNMGDFPQVSC